MSIIVSLSVLLSIVVVSFVVGLFAGISIMTYFVFKKNDNEDVVEKDMPDNDAEKSQL